MLLPISSLAIVCLLTLFEKSQFNQQSDKANIFGQFHFFVSPHFTLDIGFSALWDHLRCLFAFTLPLILSYLILSYLILSYHFTTFQFSGLSAKSINPDLKNRKTTISLSLLINFCHIWWLFVIWTNVFCNLMQYIWSFGQIDKYRNTAFSLFLINEESS